MKRVKILRVLPLCIVGLLFFVTSSFMNGKTLDGNTNQAIAPPTLHTVIIKDMVFKPSELHVKKGDTVMWINNDIVMHNIADFPKRKWTSKMLRSGKSWKKVIDTSFDYFCTIHPEMKGKVLLGK